MHILKRNYVETDQGLLVSKPPEVIVPKVIRDRGRPIGLFRTNIIRDGKELGWQSDFNLVVDEGLEYIINSAMPSTETGVTRETDWYIFLFSNAYTPQATDTMASLSSYGEITAYDEAARVEWVLNGAASSKTVSNSSAPSTFNINSSVTCNGAGITTVSTKSSTSGTLLAAANYSPARSLVNGDDLLVQYDITMSSS